ncbi:MAG: hypothetical protein QXG00_05950 [Candidatus Woesearchaeota archaeon]
MTKNLNLAMKCGVFSLVFLAFTVSASAWYCVDSDQNQPLWNRTSHRYGPWGDDGFIGGNSTGWMNTDTPPEGCTRTGYFQAKCSDVCIGTRLREFYCSDKPNSPWHTVIFWHDYENSDQCYQVPEFGTIAAGLGIIGSIAGVIIIRRRN